MADPSIKDLAYRGLAAALGGPVGLAGTARHPLMQELFPDGHPLRKYQPGPVDPSIDALGAVWGPTDIIPEAVKNLTGSDTAAFLSGFVSPSSLRKAPNVRNIFVGKGSKTWDAIAASKAQMLEDIGTDPRVIWQETGTWKGPDGIWRQEISDQGAKITDDVFYGIKDKQRFEGPMSKALTHEDLYKAYPDTGDIKSGFYAWKTPEGSYHRATDTITAGGPSTGSQKSAALHELQHSIQDREGFARGGTPSEFKNKQIPKKLKDVAFSRDMSEMYLSRALEKSGVKASAEGKMLNINTKANRESLEKLAINDASIASRLAEYDSASEKLAKYPTAKDQYRRLAGEAEARATQARMRMTPEQRLATFPEDSYDVPTSQLIVKKGLAGTAEYPVSAMTAWHGSPHKFDKFDLSKRGTGEGAQAYGDGAYLAEARGVGEEYAKNLSRLRDQVIINGKEFDNSNIPAVAAELGISEGAASKVIGNISQKDRFGDFRDAAFNSKLEWERATVPQWDEAISVADRVQPAQLGHLYKTDIPDEAVARMLDWDKPLSEQPQHIQDVAFANRKELAEIVKRDNAQFGKDGAINSIYDLSGGELYRELSRSLDESESLMRQRDALFGKYQKGKMSLSDAVRAMSPEDRAAFSDIAHRIDDQKHVASKASQRLNELGIPGIRYLDGGSRATGEGTSNFVVFDPDMIRILERNGIETTAKPWLPGEYKIPGVAAKADDLSYRGSHTAPSPDFGAPLHDLTGGGQMYPADVYSTKAVQYYGTGFPTADKEAFAIARSVKGNPDATVTMYRAVPKDASIKAINKGDWVTLSKEYAKGHGESVLGNDYKIIEQKVKAKDLWTNADSIHEFGYWPQ